MAAGAIIVGAGAARRAGFDKVFADLAGRPVVHHSLSVLQACRSVTQIVLVLSEENLARGEALRLSGEWPKLTHVCRGGRRRQDSVANGLALIGSSEWVIVHDAARPLITVDIVERGLAEAAETGAAVAAVPVIDTIKVVDAKRIVSATPPRDHLWAVQTPQVFRLSLLREAYAATDEEVTDDAALLERLGHRVRVYMGANDNVKITRPGDLELAAFLLEQRRCRA